MNKNLGPQILKLREEGKTYQEIVNILGTNKGTVSYHCGKGQKEKTRARAKKYRKKHPFIMKLESYNGRKKQNLLNKTQVSKNKQILYSRVYKYLQRGVKMNTNITVDDVINKFGETPVCYLTGQSIDINKPKTYQFDHIIPVSRGGDNSLENLGICIKEVNQAKHDMTPEEFIQLCKRVVEYNS